MIWYDQVQTIKGAQVSHREHRVYSNIDEPQEEPYCRGLSEYVFNAILNNYSHLCRHSVISTLAHGEFTCSTLAGRLNFRPET